MILTFWSVSVNVILQALQTVQSSMTVFGLKKTTNGLTGIAHCLLFTIYLLLFTYYYLLFQLLTFFYKILLHFVQERWRLITLNGQEPVGTFEPLSRFKNERITVKKLRFQTRFWLVKNIWVDNYIRSLPVHGNLF